MVAETMVPAAQDFAENMRDAIEDAKLKLQEAQARQAYHANQHRRDVKYKVGDKVRLSTVNLKLPSTMARKLAAKYIGPFKVVKVVSPVAYKLQLPPTMKRIHPVFHVSMLQPWRVDAEHPGHKDRVPPPPVVPDDRQHLVEKLLDKRVAQYGRVKRVEYLVRWEGYGPEEDEWRPVVDIHPGLIAEYEATHHGGTPAQPRSTRKAARRRHADV